VSLPAATTRTIMGLGNGEAAEGDGAYSGECQ